MGEHYGWSSFTGVGKETIFGDGVVASEFFPFVSETMALEINQIEDTAIRNTPSQHYMNQGTKKAGGGINAFMSPEGFDQILKNALGASTPVLAPTASATWDHTIVMADTLPVGLTVQVNKGGSDFVYTGSHVNTLGFSLDINNYLVIDVGFFSKDEEISPGYAAAAPTYAALYPFVFHEGIFKIDTSAAELLNFNCELNNNLKDDKYQSGSQTVVSHPRNGLREVTGTFHMEVDDLTEYTKFTNGTPAALQLKFTSKQIAEAAIHYDLEINFPVVKYTGTTPQVAGPELIEHDIPFKALFDVSGVAPEMNLILRNTNSTIA